MTEKVKHERFDGSPEWQHFFGMCTPEEKVELHDRLRKAKAHLVTIINQNPKLKAKIISWIRPDLALTAFEADILAAARNAKLQGQYCIGSIKNANKTLDEVYAEEKPKMKAKSNNKKKEKPND